MIALLFLSLVGCTKTEGILLHFDGPIAAAIVPGGSTIFDEPVGLIASQRSGVIVPVDLKAGRLLTLSKTASFLRAPALPTGQDRLLGDVEVYVDAEGATTVWATDTGAPSVLRIPWYSLDDASEPVLIAAEADVVEFVDVDGSGDDASLGDVVVRDGFTTTEDWSVSYDGSAWWVEGSASGSQTANPMLDVPWVSDHGELAFTLSGSATAGDRFDVHTETGLVELPTADVVIDLLAVGDEIWGSFSDDEGGAIQAWDAVTGELRRTIRFEVGTGAGRMVLANVEGVDTVFVADTRLPQVHRVDVASGIEGELIPAAAAVIDLAYSAGDDVNGDPFTHLFIAPLALNRVDVYDPVLNVPFDPNPITPEMDGVYLGSPISGLAASIGSVWQQKVTSWGARPRVPAVAVSSGDGYVFQLDGSTGCAVTDLRGPHGPNQLWSTSDAYVALDDIGATSDSALWIDSYSGEQATFSNCGGVAQSETWTITYDAATTSWSVEGSSSGLQSSHAFDDVRYLSDDGAISFLIISGALPPTAGDQFLLSVSSGLLTIKGVDTDKDGTIEDALAFPGRPAAFDYLVGPDGGGWNEADRREMLLLPLTDADTAARIELDGGKSEVQWL